MYPNMDDIGDWTSPFFSQYTLIESLQFCKVLYYWPPVGRNTPCFMVTELLYGFAGHFMTGLPLFKPDDVCISEPGNHWCRHWLAMQQATIDYLNHWHSISLVFSKKFQWRKDIQQSSFNKIHFKIIAYKMVLILFNGKSVKYNQPLFSMWLTSAGVCRTPDDGVIKWVPQLNILGKN